MKYRQNFYVFSFLLFVSYFNGAQTQNLTFTNPILDRRSADPSVLRVGDYYYLTLSDESETVINIYKSDILTDFRNAEKFEAYRAKNGQGNLWASEMHSINGKLYIYFTMDRTDGQRNKYHRMHVITTDGDLSNWTEPLQLMPDWESESLDGTVFQHAQSNKLYFVYASTYPDPGPGPRLAIFIAPMEDPFTVSSNPNERILLRAPKYDWECQEGNCIVEGPYFFYNKGTYFMIFSASGAFSSGYCLGLMSINETLNPMDTTNWDYGINGCVFEKNEAEGVYSPGHATITTSVDGTETWLVYHASATEIVKDRIARIDKISWDQDGKPVFPKPHGFNSPMSVPSGQLHT